MSTAILHHRSLSGTREDLPAWWLWVGWLLAGLLLCAGLGESPVRRTQEARVLETARQMVQPQMDSRPTLQRWLVPSLNGELRLRKPPLASWAAALSYEVGGVSRFSGRLPGVICGWFTLLATYRCGRWLMGPRGGVVSAICLFSSYMFYVHDRFAETDSPAMLFCTLAIYFWWRAMAGDGGIEPASAETKSSLHSRAWFIFGAIATALAILSKGGPGVFPPLFLIAMIVVYRRWDALRGFIISGAPLVLFLLAAPWFWYVQHGTHSDQLGDEINVLLEGEDHASSAAVYIAQLLGATVPWAGFMVVAIVCEVARCFTGARQIIAEQTDAASRSRFAFLQAFGSAFSRERVPAGLLIWAMSVLVPLCCIGNKQPHYLMPSLPPLMMLIAWWLEVTFFRASDPVRGSTPIVIAGTMIATAVVIPGVLIAARMFAHHVHTADIVGAALAAVLMLAVVIACSRGGLRAGLPAYFLGICILVPALLGIWAPQLQPDETQLLATQLTSRFGGGPYANWGRNFSLPLCYEMRQTMPEVHSPQELQALLARWPNVVLILKTSLRLPTPPPPSPYVEAARLKAGSQAFVIYTNDHPPISLVGPH